MKKPNISSRVAVIVGAVALCAAAASAQQPAFQPAPQPLQLQQPVQAQPASAPPVYQSAPPPLQQQQQSAAPPPAQPQQQDAQGAQPPVQSGGGAGTAAAPQTGVIDAQSTMRLGVELSAEALASAPYLYYDRGKRPGVGRVALPEDRYIYQRFDKAVVEPIKKELPFKIGDTVDVLKYIQDLKAGGERTCLVARAARGVVFGFAGRNAVVRLTDIWGKVEGAELVERATPFLPLYVDNKPVSGANINAKVLMHLDKTVAPYAHQYIIIDKGSEAGVKVGDFFRVIDRERSNRMSEELVEAQVVSVTPKASTLVLQKVYRERLKPGDEAYLSFRAAAK